MAVVSNSSPLIALARIQRLDLLPAIFGSVLIPPAVAREISPSIPVLPAWLQIQAPSVLKSIRPELDALVRTAFFLSAQLYSELLQAADEIDS